MPTVNFDLEDPGAHSHKITVDKDFDVAFLNPPALGHQIEFEMEIVHDGLTSTTWTVTLPVTVRQLSTISVPPNARGVYVFRTNDNGANYDIIQVVGGTTGTGSGSAWSTFPATQDVNFATFDGINIDRLLFDKALGSSLTAAQAGITSDATGNINANVPTGAMYNFGINADGSPRLQISNTTVVSQSILPVDPTAVTGDTLGAVGTEWARLVATDVVLKSGDKVSKIIFDGDASTSKTYFTSSATTGRVNFYSEIASVATNVAAFTNSNVELFGTTDFVLGTGQIKAGGATKGVENLGHLDFVDNTATPASALSIYSDGTDLLANTGAGVKNLSDIGAAPVLELDDLTDVTTSSPSVQHVLKYNGSNFVNSPISLGNLDDIIITAPATNSYLKYNGSEWIDSVIVDGDLPSTVVHSDLITNFTQQQTFAASGTSLVVTNRANFNGDVSIANGNIISDVTLLGDKVFRSSNSTEIGYLVTNDTGSAGSEGTIQIPTTTTAPGTASVADARFGAYHGAMGIQDTGSGDVFLYVRQSDGNWAGAAFARDTLT